MVVLSTFLLFIILHKTQLVLRSKKFLISIPFQSLTKGVWIEPGIAAQFMHKSYSNVWLWVCNRILLVQEKKVEGFAPKWISTNLWEKQKLKQQFLRIFITLPVAGLTAWSKFFLSWMYLESFQDKLCLELRANTETPQHCETLSSPWNPDITFGGFVVKPKWTFLPRFAKANTVSVEWQSGKNEFRHKSVFFCNVCESIICS